uniref:Uncharacterized protein n=1 Tax=Rhizophora mucronata TaxID=61149 RepID=A0A2P2ITQ6_RHIMU
MNCPQTSQSKDPRAQQKPFYFLHTCAFFFCSLALTY